MNGSTEPNEVHMFRDPQEQDKCIYEQRWEQRRRDAASRFAALRIQLEDLYPIASMPLWTEVSRLYLPRVQAVEDCLNDRLNFTDARSRFPKLAWSTTELGSWLTENHPTLSGDKGALYVASNVYGGRPKSNRPHALRTLDLGFHKRLGWRELGEIYCGMEDKTPNNLYGERIRKRAAKLKHLLESLSSPFAVELSRMR